MKFNGANIRDVLLSNKSTYRPEVNNNFPEKKFKVVDNYKEYLGQIQSYANKVGLKETHVNSILNECRRVLSITEQRDYDCNKFCTVDNMNLPVCLGMNAFGNKYSYVAIYDLSNVFTLILSIFFNRDLIAFEQRFAEYLVHTDKTLFTFLAGYSSRWRLFYQELGLDDLQSIDGSFETYLKNCYDSYKSNTFTVANETLSNKDYSFPEVVNISIEYFTMKTQEFIINAIMQEIVELQAKEGNGIIVQSKGKDNVVIATNNPELLKSFDIEYLNYKLTLEPIVANVDYGNHMERSAIAFLKYRIENLGLLTFDSYNLAVNEETSIHK